MKTIKYVALLFIITHLSCAKDEAHLKPVTNISVDSLITMVENAYLFSNSYRDTGIVKTKFISEGVSFIYKPFKTAFLRSGQFRFEFSEIVKYIIHQNENEVVRRWWGLTEEIDTLPSLKYAISVSSGVSSTSSKNIPEFLLEPDQYGSCNIFNRLEQKAILGLESIENIHCYKTTGRNKNGDRYYIWIQKNNYLIRRISYNHEFETFRTETTIDIFGEINVEIQDKELEFAPPIK